MSSKKHKTIGVIFVLFGILFIVLAWGGHFQSRKVIDKGGRAIAGITGKKVEKSRPVPSDRTTVDHNIYYVFKTGEGKEISGSCSIRKETWDRLNVGDSIEIAYDPDNPAYNFPVSENSLVSPGMPAALSALGLISIVAGGLFFRGTRPSGRKPLPAAASSEDKRVLLLLEKIRSDSQPVFFGAHQSRVVFSNGHFVEFADSLPAAVDALRDLFSSRLSEDSIRQLLPSETEGKTGKVHAERMLSGRYSLSTPTHTCTLDAVYYDYLKMRYPRAEIFCRGPAQPVAFYQDGVLRAVVMPLKE